MKRLIITLLLFSGVSFNSQAQRVGWELMEVFVEAYPASASSKFISGDRFEYNLVGSYIKPTTNNSMVPGQKCGPLTVFSLNFMMGNPYRWQVNAKGNIYPFETIISSLDSTTYVVGAFLDSIRIDTLVAYARPWVHSGFVLSIDKYGEVNWLQILDDTLTNVLPTCVEILTNKQIVVAGLFNDVESKIWKLNSMNGYIVKSKLLPEVRTFSSVKYFNSKLYLAGSASSWAHVDTFTITDPHQTGYVNFLAQMDTSLSTTNLKSTSYVTFDFSSHLRINPYTNQILWSHFGTSDHHVIKQHFKVFDNNFQQQLAVEKGVGNNWEAFSNRLVAPSPLNGFYFLNQKFNKDYYLFNLNDLTDSAKIVWNSNAEIYDLAYDNHFEFSIMGEYFGDTLHTVTARYPNPYADSSKSQNFLAHYMEIPLGINTTIERNLNVYPNPSSSEISISLDEKIDEIQVYSLDGKLKETIYNQKNLNISNYVNGMYLIKVLSNQKVYQSKFVKM